MKKMRLVISIWIRHGVYESRVKELGTDYLKKNGDKLHIRYSQTDKRLYL